MASWTEVLDDFQRQPEADRGQWIISQLTTRLSEISRLRGDRNVILYGSAYLQKPSAPGPSLMVHPEDIHGLMGAVYQADCTKGLTLILHTPGGVTDATKTIVDYLRSKFANIEAIVPAYAMSAGTAIALSCDRIVMGRQSQLGPIDPQLGLPDGRSVSAQAVVELFKQAREEILQNPLAAHVWAPILAPLGPSLLVEAQSSLDYSESMVADWLAAFMFAADPEPASKARDVAHHFNDANTHKSHGRRIDRAEARGRGVVIEDLEDTQPLQTAVLTLYHLMTIFFEQTATAKMIWSDQGRAWMKNIQVAQG